jgi:anti-sigma factor RsiW
MTSEEFEELLPAYVEGGLTAEQQARVEAWLKRSPDACESLESYRQLDAVLESRREQVPAAGPYFRAVFQRSTMRRARDVMTAFFSFHGISGLLLAMFSVALFIYRDQITAWFSRAPALPGSGSLGLEWVREALLQFSGANMWTVTALYVGLTVAILLSTGMLVMRFLRD